MGKSYLQEEFVCDYSKLKDAYSAFELASKEYFSFKPADSYEDLEKWKVLDAKYDSAKLVLNARLSIFAEFFFENEDHIHVSFD